jgi:hypothetical protein
MSAGVALPPAKQALKRASANLVKAVGGVEAAAEFCRVGKSQLANAGSINEPSSFLPLDVVIDLEAITQGTPGWPQVSRFLAARTGHVLVRLPEQVSADALIDGPALAKLAKECGEALGALGRAVANGGSVDASEGRAMRLITELSEVIDVAAKLRRACEHLLGEA